VARRQADSTTRGPLARPRQGDAPDETGDPSCNRCCARKIRLCCASMTDRWEVAPTLGVPNVLEAVDFFCEKLGFTRPLQLYGPRDAPVYAIVSRGNISVHLQIRRRVIFTGPREDHEGDGFFRVENADALRAELLAKGVSFHRDIQDEPYGLRDFTIARLRGLTRRCGLLPRQDDLDRVRTQRATGQTGCMAVPSRPLPTQNTRSSCSWFLSRQVPTPAECDLDALSCGPRRPKLARRASSSV
jgi:catechol 2,3-dioxygenase-like lactoylglutathione lyase family enzyme